MIMLNETHAEALENASPQRMLDLLVRLRKWAKDEMPASDTYWDWTEADAMIQRLRRIEDDHYFGRYLDLLICELRHPDLIDDLGAEVPEANRSRTIRAVIGPTGCGVSFVWNEPFGEVRVNVNLDDLGARVTAYVPGIGYGYNAFDGILVEDGVLVQRLHRSPSRDAGTGWKIENR